VSTITAAVRHWPIVARLSVYISGVGYILLLTRLLGPSQFGQYAYLSTLVELLSIVVSLGSQQIVDREAFHHRRISLARECVVMFTIAAVLLISLLLVEPSQWMPGIIILTTSSIGALNLSLLRAGIAVGRPIIPLFDFAIRYCMSAAIVWGLVSNGSAISPIGAIATQIIPIAIITGIYISIYADIITVSVVGPLEIKSRVVFLLSAVSLFAARRAELLILGVLSLYDASALVRIALLVSEVPTAFAQAQLDAVIRRAIPQYSRRSSYTRFGRRFHREAMKKVLLLHAAIVVLAPAISWLFFGDFMLVLPLAVISVGMAGRSWWFPTERVLALRGSPLQNLRFSSILMGLKILIVWVFAVCFSEAFYLYALFACIVDCVVCELELRRRFRRGLI
jgi:O-antigen/teichoic acid export membrane protein